MKHFVLNIVCYRRRIFDSEIAETIGMWKHAGIQSVYLQLLDLDKYKREND